MYILIFNSGIDSEELEENPSGLDEEIARKHVFQVRKRWISQEFSVFLTFDPSFCPES